MKNRPDITPPAKNARGTLRAGSFVSPAAPLPCAAINAPTGKSI
jgi:hypothetical protein